MISFSKLSAIAVLSGIACSSYAAKICIDPGHGGSDPGAVGSGQQEKVNVLNTGLKFRTWLNTDNTDTAGGGSWTVIMTRTTDVYVDLSARATYANNNAAARFMSIHNNACCGATGTETFSYTDNGATSNDLRNKVQQRSIEAWGLTNRGNKTANFAVLRETAMPAILGELGFIDNAYDSQFVGNATQQDKMAKYWLYATQNHYSITAYTPSTGPVGTNTIVDNSNAGFTASASWSTGSSAADKYGADYRFRTTAAVSDAAQWTANLGTGGSYDISAWWTAGTNRSTTAPYILPDNASVSKNQQAGGGAWQLLGTKTLASGSNVVKLSCWTTTGFVVVADAVKFYGPK